MKGIGVFCVLLLLSTYGAATPKEPAGRLRLMSAFVSEFLQPPTKDYANMTVTCSTLSAAGRVQFKYPASGNRSVLGFYEGEDLKVNLLSHESVECELSESTEDEESENSHGSCEYTYARFLSARGNFLTCNLQDGSAFTLHMDCGGPCPAPVPPAEQPYCKKMKRLLPVDIGKSHCLNDGSPGFALYAPNSRCVWKMPRARRGATNFLFSRLDLGNGDTITAYASDGKRREVLKVYNETSVPESVSTSAKFLILEFTSDGSYEGLGFAGFYYYSENVVRPVAIAPRKRKTKQRAPSPSAIGRKMA